MFDGGSRGNGPVEGHNYHPVNPSAIIDDLLKDKASLQSERNIWTEQFEKAVEGLPSAGVEDGRSQEEIRKAQTALVTDDTALAESIYHPVNLSAIIDDLLKDKASLQSERNIWKEQFEKAVEGLPSAGVEDGRSQEEIRKAQTALVTGDTALAESIYRARLQRLESQTAGKQLAETHRNLGALAFLHDTQLALDHYRQSTVLDADDPYGWNQLGLLLLRIGELSEAENAYQQVLRIASSTDDGRELQAVAYGNLGNVHQILGELDKAVEMYEQSLALHTQLGSKEGMANQYGNLGIVHKTRGELDKAVEMYEQSLALHTQLGSKEGMAIGYGNLGNVHRIRGELDKAVEMYEQSLTLHTELRSKEGMADQYGNLGIVHGTRGELDQAVALFEQALALNTKLGSKEGMANQYGNLGIVHQSRGELDQAVAMHEKALALNTELRSKEGMAIQYANLGNVHRIRGELDQARASWQRSVQIFQEIGSPTAVQVQSWIDELDAG